MCPNGNFHRLTHLNVQIRNAKKYVVLWYDVITLQGKSMNRHHYKVKNGGRRRSYCDLNRCTSANVKTKERSNKTSLHKWFLHF